MQAFSLANASAVAIGAAAGALCRWAAGVWFNTVWAGFPLGTLLVNCVGAALIGGSLAWFSRWPDDFLRLLFVTGFLGGLTTFSAFSLESLHLLQKNEWGMAALHTTAHVLGALACAAIGFRLARVWLG